MNNLLERLRIRNAGPIDDLTLEFREGVTVIAGPNASGKTTILLAASSAYNPTHINQAGLFDPLLPHRSSVTDENQTELEFKYRLDGKPAARTIRMRASMTHTELNERPMRSTYVKTLGHLSSVPDAAHHDPRAAADVANRALGTTYREISLLPGARNYELAVMDPDGAWRKRYHMSYGEIAVATLAYDLTRIRGGLALLDQLETGLHPAVQKNLMRELTDLSEKNDIQFIITTHSPEIMAPAPVMGQMLLRMDSGGPRVIRWSSWQTDEPVATQQHDPGRHVPSTRVD